MAWRGTGPPIQNGDVEVGFLGVVAGTPSEMVDLWSHMGRSVEKLRSSPGGWVCLTREAVWMID